MLVVPPDVGMPKMAPVALFKDRPAGKPVADQVYGDVPPTADSVAE